MKRLHSIIIFICLLLPIMCMGQTLNDFKYLGDKYGGDSYIGVSFSYATLMNNAAPRPEKHHLSAPLLEIEFNRITFDKGKVTYRTDYKLITDLLFITGKMINRKSNGNNSEGSAVGCGIIGWHNFGWNVVAKPKLCIAPGFAINDYFVGSSYVYAPSSDLVTQEPQGWYIATGPALFTHHYINRLFLLHLHSAYTFAFARPISITYAVANDSYPKPEFFHFDATLMTRWGIFAEAQYTRLINKGNIPNQTQRIDLKLGFSFVY